MTKGVVTFRIDQAEWRRFRELCARHGVSPGERLRRLIDLAIREGSDTWREDTHAGRSPGDAGAASEPWINTVLRARSTA